MDEMSLQEQIDRLEDMKDELNEFCNMMRQTMDSMQSQIKELRANGLSVEVEEKYQQRYYAPANAEVEEVIHNVYTKHMDYLDDVLEHLRRVLNQ